jgi:hypothetical protein
MRGQKIMSARLISKGKGEGKTTECIDLSASTWAYIVCPTQQDCARVFAQAKTMGKDIPYPIAFREFIEGAFGKRIKGFIIDDLDRCMSSYSKHVPIIAFSVDERGSNANNKNR